MIPLIRVTERRETDLMHRVSCPMMLVLKHRDDLVNHRIRITLKVSRLVKFTVSLIGNRMHFILESVRSTSTVCYLDRGLQEVLLLLDEGVG